ncbi:UNVERIFIED_CONTAM: hypothetical protein GTU68_022753 [Idotea baltica]|nr:hypothetical protein [Idotea baltica]
MKHSFAKHTTFIKHSHGGQLTKASEDYGIPLSAWLDLSTGISPFTCPLPTVPTECWQRLPEANDGLESAAANYYGSEFLLPVAGSQEAIQKLPLLFPPSCNVGIISPAYHSHQQAWQVADHNIVVLSPDEVKSNIASLDILIVVNPTNPNTQTYTNNELSNWHKQLVSKNGFLIIDEAFIDSTPEQSLIESSPKSGLIVLRSMGKFFGLAGIRLGFVWAETDILKRLAMLQEDWSVSNPARWAGKIALTDKTWQQQQRLRLSELSLRLKELLQDFLIQYDSENSAKSGGVSFNTDLNTIDDRVKHTALFAYFEHPEASLIHQALAKQGILTRLFDQSGHNENALRFGLPAMETQWQRLEQALTKIINQHLNNT